MCRQYPCGVDTLERMPRSTCHTDVAAEKQLVHGIVLAGTHSWGNSPLDRYRPKPLWPIGLKPLMQYPLEWLAGADVSRIFVCANSNTPEVRSHFGSGDSIGVRLDYFEDPSPRGPAGCIRDSAARSSADAFVVVEGTLMPRTDLAALLNAHRRTGAAVTMAVIPSSYDRGFEPAGIYVFTRRAIQDICDRGYQDIKEGLFPRLYQKGEEVRPYELQADAVSRVTDTASYFALNFAWTAAALDSSPPSEFERRQDAWVHKGAYVHPTVRLIGPSIIGQGAQVHRAATIIGPAVVGEAAIVAEGAVIANSVLWPRCFVGESAEVSQSVVVDDGTVNSGQSRRRAVIRHANASACSRVLAGIARSVLGSAGRGFWPTPGIEVNQ